MSVYCFANIREYHITNKQTRLRQYFLKHRNLLVEQSPLFVNVLMAMASLMIQRLCSFHSLLANKLFSRSVVSPANIAALSNFEDYLTLHLLMDSANSLYPFCNRTPRSQNASSTVYRLMNCVGTLPMLRSLCAEATTSKSANQLIFHLGFICI